MRDNLIERVARAMDPLAWIEYGDRNHRQLTLNHARTAIYVLIETLADEAYDKACHRVHQWSDTNTDWLEVPDWLRSHLDQPNPGHEDVDGYTFIGVGGEDHLPVYQKDADSSLWFRSGEAMIPFSMTHDHTHGLGRVRG